MHHIFLHNFYICPDIQGECRITSGNANAIGTAYFEGTRQRSVYSCTSTTSHSNYHLHVIGVYEAGSGHSFNYHPTYTSNVCITINGSLSDKPLIIVLSTYEPVQWVLHIPEGLVVNKVILVKEY